MKSSRAKLLIATLNSFILIFGFGVSQQTADAKPAQPPPFNPAQVSPPKVSPAGRLELDKDTVKYLPKYRNSSAIRELSLSSPFLTDKDLENLGGMSNLESLSLSSKVNLSTHWETCEKTGCKDKSWGEGLKNLSALKKLKHLGIEDTAHFDGKYSREISNFPNLESLTLQLADWDDSYPDRNCNIDLDFLQHLPKLKNLVLERINLSHEALTNISRMQRLTSLSLRDNTLTNKKILQLTGCNRLENLDIVSERLSVAGVEKLSNVPKMEIHILAADHLLVLKGEITQFTDPLSSSSSSAFYLSNYAAKHRPRVETTIRTKLQKLEKGARSQATLNELKAQSNVLVEAIPVYNQAGVPPNEWLMIAQKILLFETPQRKEDKTIMIQPLCE